MEGGVWVEGNLTMSRKEVDRVRVMQQVAERRILRQEVPVRLGIGVRQVKRGCKNFCVNGHLTGS